MSRLTPKIDFHVHPVIIEEALSGDRRLEETVREVYHIGTAVQPLDALEKMLRVAGIDKAVLLSIDTPKGCLPPNDSLAAIIRENRMFIGFAGIDPTKGDESIDELENLVSQGFRGVKLYPPLQGFRPSDKRLYGFYERVQQLNVPILFHTGVSWIKDVRLGECHPLEVEKVVTSFPALKVVLAHMGFPWVWEAAMMAVKYENVYLDLSGVFMGTPKEHISYVLTKLLTPGFVSRFLADKILFGSDWPRIEPFKMVEAVKSIPMEKHVFDKIMGLNAVKLLGLEEV